MIDPIIVYGAGGHAKAVIDTIEKDGRYRIAGLLDGYKPAGTSFYGYEILGDEAWLAANADRVSSGIIAIGDNWKRANIADAIRTINPQFHFVTAIHPTASVARGAAIGAGSVLMAGAIINSDTIIGEHNVLYTHASVDHDCNVGRFVTFAPKAATGGNVSIGDYSVVSMGANIIHGQTIGEHSVIGAGSTVLTSIASHVVAYGTPAKVIRNREAGERYL
ncbi:acetyltransferase [Paenibacillus alkaliterrae]|uniref:acetyltransferase n=1 Tax=Paenibacillus alkaliterrae TaxID=320909 RepID=UPI001F1F45EB|nr:acetyltransferase [Paenibacillus alkaliterrae]MCF2937416.1 acetyltransferase [Paenibacillus alkaliterrae]